MDQFDSSMNQNIKYNTQTSDFIYFFQWKIFFFFYFANKDKASKGNRIIQCIIFVNVTKTIELHQPHTHTHTHQKIVQFDNDKWPTHFSVSYDFEFSVELFLLAFCYTLHSFLCPLFTSLHFRSLFSFALSHILFNLLFFSPSYFFRFLCLCRYFSLLCFGQACFSFRSFFVFFFVTFKCKDNRLIAQIKLVTFRRQLVWMLHFHMNSKVIVFRHFLTSDNCIYCVILFWFSL